MGTPRHAYYRRLRQRIGHELVLTPAVHAVILDDEGCVILTQVEDEMAWALPGGIVDVNETVHGALEREVLHGTGLRISESRLVGVFSGPSFEAALPNGDRSCPITMVFEAVRWKRSPEAGSDVMATQAFAFDALPAGLVTAHRTFIDGYLKWREDSRAPVVL